MIKRTKSNFILVGLAVLLLCFPLMLRSENNAKGNIIGFVYGQDGTTPLEGAVVKVKNIATGKIYESSKSDVNGVFTIVGIDSGVYLYGVLTPEGEFSSENYFGLRVSEGETAKLSIALTPYEQKVAAAMQEVYSQQAESGESLVGTVIDYNSNNSTAEVLIVKGLLQRNDKIHAKGKATNFYQLVEQMMLGNAPVSRLFAGQKANLKVKKPVKNGDLVYVVCKRGLLPFLRPLGLAALIGGSAGIIVLGGRNLNKTVHAASPSKK